MRKDIKEGYGGRIWRKDMEEGYGGRILRKDIEEGKKEIREVY